MLYTLNLNIMKAIIYNLALASLFLASCGTGDKTKTSSNNIDSDGAVATAGSEAKATVKQIFAAYFDLKNALAQDNSPSAADAAKQVIGAMNGLDKGSLSKEQAAVFNDIYDDAKEHAEHVAGNGGNLAHQREHFETLSEEMVELAKVTPGEKLYLDHCPMFNDGKGANWLSESKAISNPYLGKSMLNCGTVKKEIN